MRARALLEFYEVEIESFIHNVSILKFVKFSYKAIYVNFRPIINTFSYVIYGSYFSSICTFLPISCFDSN